MKDNKAKRLIAESLLVASQKYLDGEIGWKLYSGFAETVATASIAMVNSKPVARSAPTEW